MEIQCECGKFRAELTGLPENTPGRLKCYCDDCQAFLYYLNRADLLDENGGSEIIPAYPAEIRLISGQDTLQCTRIHPHGMYRFSTSCCNTPITNTDPNRPWAGIHRRMFGSKDPAKIEKLLGPIKSSVMGKFAKGTPPLGTPEKFDFKGARVVLPFILKGKFLGKAKGSPFFKEGRPIVKPKILTADELKLTLANTHLSR